MLTFADGKTCSCLAVMTMLGGNIMMIIPDMSMMETITFLNSTDLSRIVYTVGERS